MRNLSIGTILVVVAVLAVSPAILAQTAQQSGARANATPDLSGFWSQPGFHPEFTTTDGSPPPMQPWAAERYRVIRRALDGDNTEKWERSDRQSLDLAIDPFRGACVPAGVPRVYTSRSLFEIYQVPGRVIQIFEASSGVRVIYTDGRGHLEDWPPTFMGRSIGRWDGDTLVVETGRFRGNDETWLDRGGHPHTDALRVVERIRRVQHDLLEVNLLIDDPKAYTKPWEAKVVFQLRPNFELMPTINCEEHFQKEHMPEIRRLMKELAEP